MLARAVFVPAADAVTPHAHLFVSFFVLCGAFLWVSAGLTAREDPAVAAAGRRVLAGAYGPMVTAEQQAKQLPFQPLPQFVGAAAGEGGNGGAGGYPMATRLLLDLVHTAAAGGAGTGSGQQGGQPQGLKGNGFAADEMAELSYKRAIAAALTVAEAEFRIAHEASLSAERGELQTELCDKQKLQRSHQSIFH